jgi:hypothetical protein
VPIAHEKAHIIFLQNLYSNAKCILSSKKFGFEQNKNYCRENMVQIKIISTVRIQLFYLLMHCA